MAACSGVHAAVLAGGEEDAE